MAVESIEITPFDPNHPLLSTDPSIRPFEVSSVGMFAVLLPTYNLYVAVHQKRLGWSIPAGRVEPSDADLLSAAQREFMEETSGGIDDSDITHMGIVTRRRENSELSRSLVFRARVSSYHFGITHELRKGIVSVAGDAEVTHLYFGQLGEGLPHPIYRPEINIPVVESFSKIKD